MALLALAAMVGAHLGSAIDNGPHGREWLEQIVLASAATAVLALLVVAGITFAFILKRGEAASHQRLLHIAPCPVMAVPAAAADTEPASEAAARPGQSS